MNSQVILTESHSDLNEVVSKIRRRDNALFFVAFASFALIVAATSTATYRWIKSIDSRIASYEQHINKGEAEITSLRSQIANQQEKLDAYAATVASYQSNVESFQSTMAAMDKGPLSYLMDFSSHQRSDIDSLRKKVDCLEHNQDRATCK